MKEMIVYVVTKGSTDGTIREGDVIWLSENLDLNCANAGGWFLKNEWDVEGTNDFECIESEKYIVNIVGRDEVVQKREHY